MGKSDFKGEDNKNKWQTVRHKYFERFGVIWKGKKNHVSSLNHHGLFTEMTRVQVLFSNTRLGLFVTIMISMKEIETYSSSCMRQIFVCKNQKLSLVDGKKSDWSLNTFHFFFIFLFLVLCWQSSFETYLTELRETAGCLQSHLRFPHSNAKLTQQDRSSTPFYILNLWYISD